MAARRSFVKNGVRRVSRWPSPHDIMFYNDGEQHHLQSDREWKSYKQVYYILYLLYIFFCALCEFWYFFRYNSCVCGYNISAHSKYLDNNTLFHLVPISNLSKAIY